MRIRLLLVVGMLVVATGAVVAQEVMMNPQYVGRASSVAEDDLAGRVNLAKWAFKQGLYNETLLEAQKIRRLNSGDLRAAYLAKAAQFYSGSNVAIVEVEPTTPTTPTTPGDPSLPPTTPTTPTETARINLTDDQVRELFAQYGAKGLNEYRASINALLLRNCGTAACHGNAETAGRLYLKAGTDNKTIAENFTAVDQYIDHRELANSALLKIAVADKPTHPGGQVLRSDSPVYRRIETWVKGLWTSSIFD